MTSKVTKHCKSCKKEMQVRVVDVKRGWGKFCSKSCKAKKQAKTMPFNKDTLTSYKKGVVYGDPKDDDDYYGFDDRHPLDIDQ